MFQLEDVRFRYGGVEVLSGVSWGVPDSGRVLLAGTNGAGKTTTLKLLAGAVAPTHGRVTGREGLPASVHALRRQVALMPQHVVPVPGLSVLEQVAFASWLGGRSSAQAMKAAAAAVEQVGLGPKSTHRPRTLSGGELRRLGLAEALARPADLLLLDEPTAGLDPAQRERFRRLVLGLDVPLVVSTHQLDDVDELFDRVVVIDRGETVFVGSVASFLSHGDTSPPGRTAESAFLHLTGRG